MANAPKANRGVSASRRRGPLAMKERAKRRVGELEGLLAALQGARRESRPADAARLEDYAIGMLHGWRVELDRPATTSSSSSSASQHHRRCLPGNSHGSSDLSSYIRRMLQLNEEDVEDDATSKHVEPQLLPPPVANPMAEPLEVTGAECTEIHGGVPASFFEGLPDHGFGIAGFKQLQEDTTINCLEESYLAPSQKLAATQTACLTFLPAEAMSNGEHATPLLMSGAFLRPKCALWDCPRPAQGLEWYHDYCSGFHATLALSEGPPGMTAPVLRPGGIDLKDGPLFAALLAKNQGKSVGIPEYPGAATTRSPWNAPELFDLSVLTGESLREWLFFDKPRRAFESGNRKQRSLPDYAGRGWHESRKQVLAEHGGLKRSYYMDPQPLIHYEWHLYEYEMSGCDACALYRLELKLAGPRKAAKGKAKEEEMIGLLKSTQDKDRTSVSGLKELEEQLYPTADYDDDRKMLSYLIEKAELAGNTAYGSLSYGYTVDSFGDLYGTT